MRKVNIISLVFFLALTLGASAEQLTVSPKELHVRSGPGVEFNVTNKLLHGAIVTQIDSKEIKPGVTWIKIDYGSGIGWINRKYVAASNSIQSKKIELDNNLRITSTVSNIAGIKEGANRIESNKEAFFLLPLLLFVILLLWLYLRKVRKQQQLNSSINPLKPISLPLSIRAAFAATLAVSILLQFASELMSNPSPRSLYGLIVALLLLAFAIRDAFSAFRMGLRLPSQSLNVHSIGATYNDREIDALMRAGEDPNEKFLSWVGHWAARASDPFSRLPVPYQQFLEMAFVAVAFGVMAWIIAIGLEAFAHAGKRSDLVAPFLSWFSAGLVVLAYAYWAAMFANFNAARWTRALSVGRVIKVIGGTLLLFIFSSFVSQVAGIRLASAPSFQPWEAIAIVGTIVIVVAIITMAWLRFDGDSSEMRCSRIQLSDSAAVHPQSVVSALRAILAQTKGGIYSEVGDWSVNLEEQRNMPGGTFSALVIGEYGATLTDVGASRSIRIFAIILGSSGITVGTVAYVVLWQAVRAPSFDPWLTGAALMLFGDLLLLLAKFPLSETLWESYLMGFQIHGSYQNRGSIMMATTEQHPGYGSILIDYSLDGGVAKAQSVSFLPATMVKADASRVLVSTSAEDKERETVLSLLRRHIVRAAGSGT